MMDQQITTNTPVSTFDNDDNIDDRGELVEFVVICNPKNNYRRKRLRRVVQPLYRSADTTEQRHPTTRTMVTTTEDTGICIRIHRRHRCRFYRISSMIGVVWASVLNHEMTMTTNSTTFASTNEYCGHSSSDNNYHHSTTTTNSTSRRLQRRRHDTNINVNHPPWFYHRHTNNNNDQSQHQVPTLPQSTTTSETSERFRQWIHRKQRRRQERLRNDNDNDIPMIDDSEWMFHLHPTSILSNYTTTSERRTLMRYSNNDNSNHNHSNTTSFSSFGYHHHHHSWFAPEETSAIYAPIPDQHDPKHRTNRLLQQFYQTRHFSRYERHYRATTVHSYNHPNSNQSILYNWNGQYNDTTFLQQFVHFDDELFFSTFYNNGNNHEPLYNDNYNANNNITSKKERHRRRHNPTQTGAKRHLQRERLPTTTMSHDTIISGGIYNNYQSVPLSQGYGTHFANVWVGTPVPQRKTVIVDTGSHYTAFPCTGCKDCGAPHHTDPYYRPENSKTFQQLQCNECQDSVPCENSRCKFSQAYTEGSSWEAIQVRDQFYCGGTDVLDSASPTDQKYGIEFMFGCQMSMTGLFKTQLADGIMGMSAHPATLPKKLFDAKKLEHNMFAMCYRRELGTSKRGVSAGSMTLGGVSNNLDTSPFVFAKNVVKVGWFTVYVKNIYVRSGGGQSARSVDPTHHTIQVRLNAKTLNSGKGVIVDSGTTDTYLNKRVAADFTKAWKKATGQAYSHVPLSLTPEQLRSLPTVLIQCQAFSKSSDPTIEDYDTIPGYTGSLDPTSPRDLLIAIPATSYMDYSPITQRYMSRLYFTESVGGVLGSNTMQGHNVLFDWQNGRVGFAESSCTYDKKDVPEVTQDNGFASDCRVSDPILTQPCVDTVDRSLCDQHPTGISLFGNETWTAIVENPGNDAGVPCFEPLEPVDHIKNPMEPTIICGGQGICEEFRPCLLTCPQVKMAADVIPLPSQLGEKKKRFRCGDSGWSACDYGCAQTRISSRAYSDGTCHEVKRISRQCHIGACSRDDPCRVPFVVHVVLAFRNGLVKKWTKEAEDILAVALTNVVDRGSGRETPLFTAGDVHISMALPWYQDQDEYDIESNDESVKRDYGDNYNNVILGLKVVVEISMYNPLSDLPDKIPIVENDQEESNNGAFASMLRNITYLVQGRKPRAICSPEELYPLAKLTVDTKEVIRGETFMASLIDELKTTASHDDTVAFGPISYLTDKVSESRVASVWTIRTGIEDEINYFGPQKTFSVRMLSILRNMFFFSTLFFLTVVLWNIITAIHNFCLGGAPPKRSANHKMTATPRNIPYSIITRIEDSNNNPYDVEDSIIMGLGEDIELPNQVTYKSSMVTKRANRTSPISNKSNHH